MQREANRGATVRRISVAEAVEITEARAALEGLIARLAAERATDADRERAARPGRRRWPTAVAGRRQARLLQAQPHAARRRCARIARHRVADDLVANLRNRAAHHQFRWRSCPAGRPSRWPSTAPSSTLWSTATARTRRGGHARPPGVGHRRAPPLGGTSTGAACDPVLPHGWPGGSGTEAGSATICRRRAVVACGHRGVRRPARPAAPPSPPSRGAGGRAWQGRPADQPAEQRLVGRGELRHQLSHVSSASPAASAARIDSITQRRQPLHDHAAQQLAGGRLTGLVRRRARPASRAAPWRRRTPRPPGPSQRRRAQTVAGHRCHQRHVDEPQARPPRRSSPAAASARPTRWPGRRRPHRVADGVERLGRAAAASAPR